MSQLRNIKWAAECEENLKGYFQGVRTLTNFISLRENSLLSQDLQLSVWKPKQTADLHSNSCEISYNGTQQSAM